MKLPAFGWIKRFFWATENTEERIKKKKRNCGLKKTKDFEPLMNTNGHECFQPSAGLKSFLPQRKKRLARTQRNSLWSIGQKARPTT